MAHESSCTAWTILASNYLAMMRSYTHEIDLLSRNSLEYGYVVFKMVIFEMDAKERF